MSETRWLRVAQVWRDEVMADEVMTRPRPVTLGTSKRATFTVAALELPDPFVLLAPSGEDAYVLTLSLGMAGRARIAGKELDLAEQLASGRSEIPVRPGDWGVIELDAQGEHVMFFHFVARDALPPPPWWRDSELLGPALAFAIILHTVLLAATFKLRGDGNSLVFPGRRELMTAYMIRRPEPPPPPVESTEATAAQDGEKENVRAATRDTSGKAGGEGDKPRERAPEAAELPPTVQVGLMSEQSRDTIRKVTMNRAMDDQLQRSLARLQGDARPGGAGEGPGTGTGFAAGTDGTGTTRGGKPGGAGGGGSVQGEFVSQGKVDTGETRAPKGAGGTGRATKEVVVVSAGDASGDFGGLSKDEIDRVIRSRQGLIRTCYQRELDRTRGLGGTLVISFRIQASGEVLQSSVRVVPGKSSLRNAKVESCVIRQIAGLKFPAKGGGVVNYPFIFSQG